MSIPILTTFGTAPADFRRQAASAVMHPVTLGALGVLLVNDWLLKPVWQSDWTTGKLSDLAWMVFAPPVLAYILSFATLGGSQRKRAAFAASYIGLPILYVAFNTFAPVHDAILWALGLFGGDGPRSPLDPTDSLIIPPAMAVALWVWRRPPLDLEGIRARLALLAAVVALLASVASSYGAELGVTHVGRTETGALGAYTEPAIPAYGGSFQSTDGGVTWKRIDPGFVPLKTQEWSEQEVKMPSGDYFIVDRHKIVRVDRTSGDKEGIYSFRYLKNWGDRWLQAMDKRAIQYRFIADEPYGLFYDNQTGNLLLAMGLQGVVVVSPDGTATRVAVGPYSPTDFSFLNKARIYVDSVRDRDYLLFNALALLLTFTFASLAIGGARAAPWPMFCFSLAAAMATALVLTIGVYPYVPQQANDINAVISLPFILVILSGVGLLPIALTVAGLIWMRAGRRQLLMIAAAAIGMLPLIVLGALVLFQAGNFIANFVTVGLVGLAAYGLWRHQTRTQT